MDTPDFPLIQNVFVLMFENHSFDHLLGFSGITGIDAKNGNKTIINSITGAETNIIVSSYKPKLNHGRFK